MTKSLMKIDNCKKKDVSKFSYFLDRRLSSYDVVRGVFIVGFVALVLPYAVAQSVCDSVENEYYLCKNKIDKAVSGYNDRKLLLEYTKKLFSGAKTDDSSVLERILGVGGDDFVYVDEVYSKRLIAEDNKVLNVTMNLAKALDEYL